MNIIGQRFCRGAGGFGGERAPKDAKPIEIPKGRMPDEVMEIKIPANQTLIYRLSGDTMPQVGLLWDERYWGLG